MCGTADTESAASTRRPHRGPALQVHGGDEKGRAVMRWVDGVSRRWRWGTADTESDSSRSLAPQAGTATDLSITADVACGVNDSAVCQHRTATASAMMVSTVTCGAPSDGGSLQSRGFVSFHTQRTHDSLSTQHGRLRHRSATTKALSDGVHAGCGEHGVGFIEESIEARDGIACAARTSSTVR